MSLDPDWGDGTRCVHAGETAPSKGSPLTPGPVLAAPFHLADARPDTDAGLAEEADFYGRAGNPTWRRLESAIGELDGGECVLFPSGMAAISALLRDASGRGALVLPSDGYYATRAFAESELVPRGVTVRAVPTAGPWDDDVFDGAALVLLETPSNPGLDVCDIAELSARAHTAGAVVAVDNTTASPLGQRPLALGADVVVASDAKALSGHSDLLLGHVSTADAALARRLREARTLGGAIPGPFEAWLAYRSLSTLDLRLARQAENAAALTAALRDHPAVRGLRWPGSAGDAAHETARRQMRRFGGVLSFELADEATFSRFVAASRLVVEATSFGGVHSTVDRRARWGDPVAPGFVRFSSGCEDAADLVADVLAALDSCVR
ncbi:MULTISPECIES: cystathionine gamma-lyase [Actinoalloteichus]|uniref:Cystathionine beta-lyase/cystathionine gamma-synthase n=1 Tax=Actinoalloteichus fjordicus TaxID=1612552 RepID=A0AAC9PUG5_9PSEU|nr:MULTISPECIES: cystathionine gamma-lyase [Actinoalloteichus]APU17168.1 cystathionine beta-lyase/cystathionine gamma-synthase [Actinoalloteichus fjordicus]APU23251.1 cystathionine beta-lyase/cystathionine gamma-synthase [Actinoalloteichus sp. GBA129-24]